MKHTLINKAPKVNITERVKTFEDACQVLGILPDEQLKTIEDLPKDEQAYRKLKIITQALNEGWKPDWKDEKWNKHSPWFDLSSGTGLSFYCAVEKDRGSEVSPRLCFKSSELAEYAGTQFIDLYTDLFLF